MGMRAPDGDWLLYAQACCATNQYGPGPCQGCHKGQCGPAPCTPTTPFSPLPAGPITLTRRERPKMLFDKNGRPTHLYNSADPGPNLGVANPNKGWTNSRPFTMVTEVLPSSQVARTYV